MRGSPLWQAVFIVALFLLAGVPVYTLTRPAKSGAAANPSLIVPLTDDQITKPAPVEVEAVFAPAPADFQLNNLDQIVLAGSGPQTRFATRWTTAIPPEGADLVIQAKWLTPTNGDTAPPPPAAVRITLRLADGGFVEKSFWAAENGTLTEVFTVPGTPSPTVP